MGKSEGNCIQAEILNIYISPNGDDCADALSLNTSVRTFERVMEIIGQNKGRAINVNISGGKYYISGPMVFDNSNTDGSPISFKGPDSGEVVISGALELCDLVWQDYKENIKRCNIGSGREFEMMFLNSELKVLARYPNYRPDEILNGYAADCLSPERVKRWKDPSGGYIRAIHSYEWGGNDYIINSKNEDNTLNYTWVGDHNQGSGMHAEKRMVENIFEELDAPGEWFYNKETGDLYYYPEHGENLDGAAVQIAINCEIVRFTGSSCKKAVKNIEFENVHFTQSDRTMFKKQYERPLRSDWGIVRSGALYFENTENITVKNCRFDFLGGNAVMMSGYNKNNIIDGNDFSQIGASAVLIVGLESAARDYSTWDNGNHKTVINDKTPGPLTDDYPREITVSNNYMYNVGIFEKQVAGICVSISSKIHIDSNTIHHVPRAGINVGDGTFGGHIIENNDIFDTVRETGDHGPFNSWGRDRFWSLIKYDHMGLYGAEKFPYAKLDAVDTTVLRHNRIQGNRGFGIDLDDGSTNYEITNNLMLGVGIKLREGFYRTVHNNVIIGAPLDIHCTYEKNSDQIYSNIVYNKMAVRYAAGATNTGPRRTDLFERNLYWNDGEPIENATAEDGMGLALDPEFLRTYKDNNFQVSEHSPALTKAVGFRNFDMSDNSFGRADKPKPQPYFYGGGTQSFKRQSFKTAELRELSDDIRSSLAIPYSTDGVALFSIGKNSFLGKAGFEPFDVVTFLNGIKISSIEKFINAVNMLESKKEYECVIYRDGVKAQITVRFPVE